MISKIDNSPAGVVRRNETARADNSAKSANAAPAGEARPLRAAGSSLLERASLLAAAAPDIDQARVDSIKAAIANGEYRLDAEATARAFIDMEMS